ncbi:hypothetical protein [Paenibacillus gansuensis]|uniref:Uncharacterized protein n=1 Tax=Paenibacillus gansuensis TaxID=306542 RepID=A0ABW5PHP1_9BACL
MKTIFSMKKKTALLAATAALVLTVQAGQTAFAAPAPAASKPAVTAASSAQVYDTFEFMLGKRELSHAMSYLSSHITQVTKYQATIMVLHMENGLVKSLPAMTQQLSVPKYQKAINQAYKPGYSFTQVAAGVKDANLRTILKELAAAGYRLETAEGFYFPVVDYPALEKFKPYVSADIQAYLTIMSVETKKVPAKDGALMIGYQELVNRALSMERFVAAYPASHRTAKIKNMFANYKIFTFYGLNNTPLFDYSTNVMAPNAQKGYNLILGYNQNTQSKYLNLLEKFMKLAADQNYKKTAAVEKFLKENVPNK